MTQAPSFLIPSRILIVDDLPIGLAPLTLSLEKNGHQVFFCEKSEKLDEMIRRCQPDLIILDIVMPDASGIEICRELKADEKTQAIPIIFISAKEDSSTELSAFKAGGADYLTKPIHPALAKERIKVHLKIKHLNDELHKLSSTDPLTGIFNRRHFLETLEQEWILGEMTGEPLAVFILDIDHFKAYNDNYGHLEGDKCLRQITTEVDRLLNAQEVHHYTFARYGGEEFILLFGAKSDDEMNQTAEMILDGIREFNLTHAHSPTAPYVSLSLGGAMISPQERLTKDHLINVADQNLYLAKKNGRNQYVLTSPTADQILKNLEAE